MSTQTISIADEDVIELQQIGGDLQVDGWERPELEARGDSVRIQRSAGHVAISCSADLVLFVPHGAHLEVHTIGGDARLQNLGGPVELGLVGGDAILQNLTGSVLLNGPIGGDTRLENVAHMSMSSTSAGAGFEAAERIRRTVEQATRRVETKVKRAEHRAFQHSQMRIHQADSAGWRYGATRDSSGTPGDPVSDEERLTILRMLQEKKITSEQAEKLLAALEGSV
jgi:hypothetical protein